MPVLPAWSVAVQVTVVVPTGNTDPDSGRLQLEVAMPLPVSEIAGAA